MMIVFLNDWRTLVLFIKSQCKLALFVSKFIAQSSKFCLYDELVLIDAVREFMMVLILSSHISL